MSSPIQGMDAIPQEIADKFGNLFEKLLPGWSINGKYNFQAGGATQKVAAQLILVFQPIPSGCTPKLATTT